jgi:DNA-binding LytR/AlgR family response regulator
MRCVIVDDEPYALDLIKDYTERTPFLKLIETFSNPYKALDFINRVPVDMVFLDINMPELSGIQLLRSLQTPPLVVFTTAYPEFAAESYEYNAVDYLVKPIKYERFLKAVNKASSLLHSTIATPIQTAKQPNNQKDDSLFIKSGTQLVKIIPDEILFVEAAGNYMCFITKDKRVLSLLTMKEVLDILPSDNFVRIHKSYIISIKHLTAIERHDAVIGGKQIPIGITYREHFLKRMGR